MSRVLAAVTGDAAAPVVLAEAVEIARLFSASVEALHVLDHHEIATSHVCARAQVALRTAPGTPSKTIVQLSRSGDVDAVVIGSRGRAKGIRPAGSTATAVLTSAATPVVVLAPDAIVRRPISRVLVPVDGTPASTSALRRIVALSAHANLSIVVAHVHPTGRIRVRDRLPHEVRAWTEDFLAATCPASIEVSLEIRLGEPHQHILDICRSGDCDLVAVGWSQQLHRGRAPIVARLLSECRLPLMLAPAHAQGSERTAVIAAGRPASRSKQRAFGAQRGDVAAGIARASTHGVLAAHDVFSTAYHTRSATSAM